MARIRTIKPEYWTSEQVVECSRDSRLLFIGMWNFVDDGGVMPANARTLKMRVFPGDDDITSDTIIILVSELVENGLVAAYTVDNKEYWQVTGWHHQRIQKPQRKFPGSDKADNSGSVSYRANTGTIPVADELHAEGKGREKRKGVTTSSSLRSEGVPPPENQETMEAKVYRRGKEVLGKNAGGQISKLRKDRSDGQALHLIEEAAKKQNPGEWIGAVIRSGTEPEYVPLADRERKMWAPRVEGWPGTWVDQWGPPPDHPDTLVPAELRPRQESQDGQTQEA